MSGQLPELLQAYYRFLFPHKLFYKWLSYSNVENDYFARREFSFTLPGDIYVRYQSFEDVSEMEKAIVSKLPEKIDIGAVFNIKPKTSKNIGIVPFKAEQRELVFDIDMTDYDDVRTCCKGADICTKCWPFLVIAAKILNRALREDFGFKHLLWVYSGRRGIHCWVADQRARKMNSDTRNALAEYLNVIQGGEFKAKKVVLEGNQHPSIQRAVTIIDEYFESLVIEKQKLFETKEQLKFVIDLCNEPKLKSKLSKINETCLWDNLNRLIDNNNQKEKNFIDEVKLQFCYPRLDINVTKGVNHLLKSPFSVHPKTGRVCVPIEFDDFESFDPFSVPTIKQLCLQIDQTSLDGQKPGSLYEKTDLLKSIKIFQKFISDIEKSDLRELKKEHSQGIDF